MGSNMARSNSESTSAAINLIFKTCLERRFKRWSINFLSWMAGKEQSKRKRASITVSAFSSINDGALSQGSLTSKKVKEVGGC